MSIDYSDDHVTLHHGDCLEVLAQIPDASVDAVVTDPPCGLSNTDPQHVADTLVRWVNGERDYLPPTKGGFMGKAWDSFVPPVAVWDECYRVLKPGGHVLAFAGSRTHDLMTLGVRLAGFEIRDSIAWLYGSGFPKSLDVSKAITGTQMGHGGNSGAIRRATMGDDYEASGRRGNRDGVGRRDTGLNDHELDLTPDAERWQGWGTALKPAHEPIVVARKPLGGTVAKNVLEHGTGALNIDGCRIGSDGGTTSSGEPNRLNTVYGRRMGGLTAEPLGKGRWPANVVLDEEMARRLDEQSGERTSGLFKPEHADNGKGAGTYGAMGGRERTTATYGDTGGASRFFYVAKAKASERPRVNGVAHPTVKPVALMSWLVRLVTPPGGVVLEPFAGSGTTVEACIAEGFRCIAIEREDDYLPLVRQRIDRAAAPEPDALSLFDHEEEAS